MPHGAFDEEPTQTEAAEAADSTPAVLASELARLRNEIVDLRSELRLLRETIEHSRPTPPGDVHEAVDSNPSPTATIRFAGPRMAVKPYVAHMESFRDTLRQAAMTARTQADAGKARTEWHPPKPLLSAIFALFTITLVAFLLRGIHVDRIPAGLHGDEAATVIEARRILDHGWIGVYSGIAGGNPTGVYYLATIPIKLVGDPVVAVRMLSAIMGTLAVALLFLLARRNFGFGSAVAASSLLAFSEWHIQFSRTGFVTGDWPTCILLGVLALAEAIRSGRWYWWAISGFFISAGTYIYNGNGPLMVVVGGFVLWALFGWGALAFAFAIALAFLETSPITILVAFLSVSLVLSDRLRDRRSWINLAAYTLASLLTLRGLIDFIRAKPHDYFGRGEELSVFRTEQWRATSGTIDHVRFLIDRYFLFWQRMTFEPRPNGVDLSGVTPLIPRLTLAIFLVGLVVSLIRRPTPLVLLSAVIVSTIPLTAVLTDLTLRRALVIIPFLALLGGVGLIELVRLFIGRGRIPAFVAGLLLLVTVSASCQANYVDFFDRTVDSPPVRATFPIELRKSAEYMKTLSDRDYVYLFCDGWQIRYDVVFLIAPNVRGENRLPKWGGNGSLAVDWSKGQPVFLFVGSETRLIETVKRFYPRGQIVFGPNLEQPINGPAYIAYLPDRP